LDQRLEKLVATQREEWRLKQDSERELSRAAIEALAAALKSLSGRAQTL
jgi:hypothetical protein